MIPGDGINQDRSSVRILWSNGWSDIIPTSWIVAGRDWRDKGHVTVDPAGRRYISQCSGHFGDGEVLIEYNGTHPTSQQSHHYAGTTKLVFSLEASGQLKRVAVTWKAQGAGGFDEKAEQAEVSEDPFVQLSQYVPEGVEDARRFELQLVALRRGQSGFRKALIAAYNGRCAVTGCDIEAALEAAHIVPFAEGGHNVNDVTNGLLLRADIHTLFDCDLIRITADYEIETDDQIREVLRVRERLEIDDLASPHFSPSPEALSKRYNAWRARQA